MWRVKCYRKIYVIWKMLYSYTVYLHTLYVSWGCVNVSYLLKLPKYMCIDVCNNKTSHTLKYYILFIIHNKPTYIKCAEYCTSIWIKIKYKIITTQCTGPTENRSYYITIKFIFVRSRHSPSRTPFPLWFGPRIWRRARFSSVARYT